MNQAETGVAAVELVTGDPAPALPAGPGPASPLPWLVGGVGLCMVVAGTVAWARRLRDDPLERAFLRLTEAARVGRRGRAAVRRLADRRGVTPATLLVSPTMLDAALTAGAQSMHARDVLTLRRRLLRGPARPAGGV